MKFFKSLSIFLVFALAVGGLALGSLSFNNTLADEANLKEVTVTKDNAQEVFSKPWNYSTITLSGNLDFAELGITLNASASSDNSQVFKGTLNGDGHTISNLSFSNENGGNNFGLIGVAQNATIENLKITGSVTYNFSANSAGVLSIGVLLGRGDGVSISNCEIDVTGVQVEGNSTAIAYSLPATSANIGLIVGNLREGSSISDVVLKGQMNITLPANYQYNIGGAVGVLSSSVIERTLCFGAITVQAAQGSSATFDGVALGGLIGFAQGDTTIVKDNVASCTISSSDIAAGAIIGQNSANSSILNSALNYCYWSDALLQPVGKNGDSFITSQTLRSESSLTYSFISNSANFNPVSAGFNFKTVFGTSSGNIVLQQFQTFSFSIDSNLDNIVSFASFSSEGDESSVRDIAYNKDLTITLALRPQEKGGATITNVVQFYNLTDIRVNGTSKIGEGDYSVTANEDTNSFTIAFSANGYTSGSYSFTFQAKSYRAEYRVARDGDILPGGVTFSGENPIESIVQSYTIQSAQVTIRAVAQSYYTFSHWELYYQNGNGEWNTNPETTWAGESDSVSPSMQSLPINFGVAPFDRAFRLVAVFSSENGIAIDFSNLNTDRINSITVSGTTYEGSPITVLRTLTNLSVVVTMNEGYDFDSANFLTLIRSLYNENVAQEDVIRNSAVNSDGLNTYTLSINVAKIYENTQGQSITLSIPTVVEDGGDGNGLLWLWITLPCVVVVLGVGIFLIIYFKKRGQAKANVQKREKEKEVSYKDYYL